MGRLKVSRRKKDSEESSVDDMGEIHSGQLPAIDWDLKLQCLFGNFQRGPQILACKSNTAEQQFQDFRDLKVSSRGLEVLSQGSPVTLRQQPERLSETLKCRLGS